VDGAVPQRIRERLVDEAMLVEQRKPVEARARDGHLEMVAAARAVLDAQLARVRKRGAEQGLETVGGHAAMVRSRAYPVAVDEIGLFPLGVVLLPTERIPLHIFEPRYRELINECIEDDSEFGLVFADEEGVRELGTRARVTDVLERFDDGRLNIVIEGLERFRVERLTQGRSYMTAMVEPVDDEEAPAADPETAARAAGAFRALAALAEADTGEIDEDSSHLAFELAAQVELAPEAKQGLLELRSEQERLELVADLLDAARATLIATRELGERAKRNGSRLL
jgi:ATP-dependent Lon protease